LIGNLHQGGIGLAPSLRPAPAGKRFRCGGGRARYLPWLALLLIWAPLARSGSTLRAAPTPSISESEALDAPTPHRLAALQASAQREGWASQSAALQTVAFRAYERERFRAAEGWLSVYRWSALIGQSEADFVTRWLEAVQTARVGHANMSQHYELKDRPCAAQLSTELQSWLLANQVFSSAFFALLSPVDFLPRVLEILNDLHRQDPIRFKTYANLALAIAVVYDVAPPPFWPHSQVSPAALPRLLPAPTDAFAWWVRQDQQRRTFHRLAQLGASELKFVVDTPANLAELEWAQKVSVHSLEQLARNYALVRYRQDRVTGERPIWPGKTYQLADILAEGGICADQAYFAAQLGKARGVPTFLIHGAGDGGRHAWFGFLEANQQWQLDAGRYLEQRLVTGYAWDPQTWRELSDHQLQFLKQRFHGLPSFQQSRVHADFAAEYLVRGQAAAAAVAARQAVRFERRNQAGWEVLFAAAQREGRDAKTVESLLREAALAFQLFPEIEALYVNRVAASLRGRGESSAAEAEVRRIALKNKVVRTDLSVQQAGEGVTRAMATQPIPEQIRAYNSAVDNYGHGAGMSFFDRVVTPFVEHLLNRGQRTEARHALDRARRVLQVESGSQLDREFEQWQRRLALK